jgi:ribosomal protein L37AE/L43A
MVVRKLCKYCGRVSFSLSKMGAWICPHCGKDLSSVPVQNAIPGIPEVMPLRANDRSLFNQN